MKLALLLFDTSMVVIWLIALCHWLEQPREENQEQKDEADGLF